MLNTAARLSDISSIIYCNVCGGVAITSVTSDSRRPRHGCTGVPGVSKVKGDTKLALAPSNHRSIPPTE